MILDLRQATLEHLIDVIFDAGPNAALEENEDANEPFDYRVDPARQVVLLTDLFRRSFTLTTRFPSEQIERGLWHIMGAEYFHAFTQHIWNPDVSRVDRVRLIESVYDLYDSVLARNPFEDIDFRHPDRLPRRFQTIDYMAPDLLLEGAAFVRKDPADRQAIRNAFLATYSRMLHHPSPVAKYAALHGLGHLKHPLRSQVIASYLERYPSLTPDQRGYAARAARGNVL